MKSYEIGERVWLKGDDKDDEGEIFEGEVVDVCDEESKAYVAYETDYYFKHRWVTYKELEDLRELMYETADWF